METRGTKGTEGIKRSWIAWLVVMLAVGLGAALGMTASRYGIWPVGRVALAAGTPVALLVGVYQLSRAPKAGRLAVGLLLLGMLYGLAARGMWMVVAGIGY